MVFFPVVVIFAIRNHLSEATMTEQKSIIIKGARVNNLAHDSLTVIIQTIIIRNTTFVKAKHI